MCNKITKKLKRSQGGVESKIEIAKVEILIFIRTGKLEIRNIEIRTLSARAGKLLFSFEHQEYRSN